MVATDVPADGSDAIPDEVFAERGLLTSSQHLANPPHENPTRSESVLAWIKARVAADPQMRAAASRSAARTAGDRSTRSFGIRVLVDSRQACVSLA